MTEAVTSNSSDFIRDIINEDLKTNKNDGKVERRKVPGVIHWVSAGHCVPAEVRLCDRLFNIENPGSEDDFTKYLNPNSLEILKNCYVEQILKNAKPGSQFQFERLGYFCVDAKDSKTGKPVFNRVVPLRDSWAKIAGTKE